MTLVNPSDEDRMALAGLPAPVLAHRLMFFPAKRRVDMILDRPDAEAVVAAMAPQDFYATVQEMGPDDAVPLLALGQVNQFNLLFDLEWWNRELVQPAKALEWVERLHLANPRKLLAWLYKADFELLVSLFKKWIRVATLLDDEDPLEARDRLPAQTLDDTYFWEATFPQYEELITRLLEMLFEVNQAFYQELLHSVMWAVEAEVEEDAYRFHRGRLEDEAIPDFNDAVAIYRPFSAGEIRRGKVRAAGEPLAGSTAPSFAVALLPSGRLLTRALQHVAEDRQVVALQRELAALANKVLVADGLSPGSAESLRLAVEKAGSLVSLGLELFCGADLPSAEKALEEVFLEQLFTLGQGRVAEVRGRLSRLVREGWIARWTPGVRILDEPWQEMVELLLQKTPRLVRSVEEGRVVKRLEKLIGSEADLRRAGHLVDVLEALEPVYDALEVDTPALEAHLWREGQIATLADVTLGSLLCTAAARFLHEGVWLTAPIPRSEWPAVASLVEPPVLKNTILTWLDSVVRDAHARLQIQAYLEPLHQAYAEEMSAFEGKEPPTARLVKFFLFSRD